MVPHFFMMAYCYCGLLRLDEAASCYSVTCASFLWDSRFLWLCRCLIAVAAWVIEDGAEGPASAVAFSLSCSVMMPLENI